MLRADLAAWLSDIEQKHKPATVRFYRSRSRWIEQQLGDRDWTDLTSSQILRALDQANRFPDGRRKAPDTIRANTIAWEQFQGWAISTGRIERKIIEQMPPKPSGRQRDRLPSPVEVQQILDGAHEAFAAIYRALLLSGARPGELCRAQVSDYKAADNLIQLADHKTVGKTRRPRLIPVGATCRGIVEAAIGDRTDGPIFRTPTGQAWTTCKLSQSFRRRRTKLGLDRQLVLYSTRHKFATELCHAQGIEAAAAVLGHSGLQTIRRYVHHDSQQLVKYADAVDPAQLIPLNTHPAIQSGESPHSSEPHPENTHLHTVEVTGSNPVSPILNPVFRRGFFVVR